MNDILENVSKAVSNTFEGIGFIELFEDNNKNIETNDFSWGYLEVLEPNKLTVFVGIDNSLINEITDTVIGVDSSTLEKIDDSLHTETNKKDEIFNDCFLEIINTITGNLMREKLKNNHNFSLSLPIIMKENIKIENNNNLFKYSGIAGTCLIYIK